MKSKIRLLFIVAFSAAAMFWQGCSKDKTNPDKAGLPLTLDFSQVAPGRKGSFTLNGIGFQSGGGEWRKGNCAIKTPAQPLEIYDDFIGLTGAEIDYTTASSIVADISSLSPHKVTVRMYAKDAYDRITLEPLPSACITFCDGKSILAETKEMTSQTTDGNGQVIQTWELSVTPGQAKRLIISSDDAMLFSMVLE